MTKVLIAGASGFVGKALVEKLLQETDIEIVALSREERRSGHPRLTWRKADLFSLKELQEAMHDCESAFYLVHSMLPSAALNQGTFYDFDLVIADNFARAAKQFQLKKMIYLGGMIPPTGELSWHLRSRLEVEKTFRSTSIPVIALRAGLIIGPGGSSFTILRRLVERLPLLVCPAWTNTRSQPLALNDVVKVLARALREQDLPAPEKISADLSTNALVARAEISSAPTGISSNLSKNSGDLVKNAVDATSRFVDPSFLPSKNKIYDIGGQEVVTYQELILRVVLLLGKKRHVFTLNLIPLWLSRFWVMLITSSPKNLVYPLVLSLKHEMIVDPARAWPYPEDLSTPLNTALQNALAEPLSKNQPSSYTPRAHVVRSIQRLTLPIGKNAEWVALEYFHWLPSFLSGLMGVTIDGSRCEMYLFTKKLPLLIMEKSVERSSPDRQLLYIVGGLMKIPQGRGRLEFREVLDRKYVMAAIHNFEPSLPWFLYKYTQALFHLWVMKNFARHLKNQMKKTAT